MRRRLPPSAAVLLLVTACSVGQHADGHYRPHVSSPAYTAPGPRVCIDAGHNNASTAGGLYKPFAGLLRADGCTVVENDGPFTEQALAGWDVLVVVNAAGGKVHKLFGFNLPGKGRERRPLPAFTPDEIERVTRWVEAGGSLLLVADHYPFGSASLDLAKRLGVDMSTGFTEAANADTAHSTDPGQLVFSVENGLLAPHPITMGRGPSERVERVVTYTGQSLLADRGTPLLVLGDSAVDYVPPPPEFQPVSAEGRCQGVALEFGRGRVVVMGEAAALTAQAEGDQTWGMQSPDNDNEQFALNIVHWLTRLLP